MNYPRAPVPSDRSAASARAAGRGARALMTSRCHLAIPTHLLGEKGAFACLPHRRKDAVTPTQRDPQSAQSSGAAARVAFISGSKPSGPKSLGTKRREDIRLRRRRTEWGAGGRLWSQRSWP